MRTFLSLRKAICSQKIPNRKHYDFDFYLDISKLIQSSFQKALRSLVLLVYTLIPK